MELTVFENLNFHKKCRSYRLVLEESNDKKSEINKFLILLNFAQFKKIKNGIYKQVLGGRNKLPMETRKLWIEV